MDWSTIAILAILIAGLMILWSRIPSKIRLPAVVVVYFPGTLLILKWTQFREAWMEFGIALLISIAAFLAWWFALGRKLPQPKESQIVVITEDEDEQ